MDFVSFHTDFRTNQGNVASESAQQRCANRWSKSLGFRSFHLAYTGLCKASAKVTPMSEMMTKCWTHQHETVSHQGGLVPAAYSGKTWLFHQYFFVPEIFRTQIQQANMSYNLREGNGQHNLLYIKNGFHGYFHSDCYQSKPPNFPNFPFYQGTVG